MWYRVGVDIEQGNIVQGVWDIFNDDGERIAFGAMKDHGPFDTVAEVIAETIGHMRRCHGEQLTLL